MSSVYKTTFNYRYSTALISSPFFLIAFLALYFLFVGSLTGKTQQVRVLISVLPLLILAFGSIIPIERTENKSFYKSIV